MHMDLKNLSLPLTYEINESFKSERFIKLRLRFMHDHENPNGSFFHIDSMEKAKDSLKNIPILAHVIIKENGEVDHGSHDFHIEDDLINEGDSRIVYDEQPIGVIPETNNYEVAEYNGKNYAYTDGFIWVGYSGYSEDIIKRDTEIKLSMEVDVNTYVYDSKTNLYNITDYVYKGITLLGKSIGTGMVDARATTKSFSEDDKQELFTLMSELREEIIKNQSSNEVEINSKFTQEKEDKILDEEKLEIDDLEVKLKEMSAPISKMSTTYNQKRDVLINCVNSMDSEDSYSYHWLMDFDDTFLYFGKTQFNDTGYVETHGRIKYAFDDTTMIASVNGEWEEIFLTYLTAAEKATIESEKVDYTQTKTKFEDYKTNHLSTNAEVEILRNFQSNTLAGERKEAEEEIFNKFEKLNGNEEFEALKEKSINHSLDEISDKCFSILGKVSANFSLATPKKKGFIKIPVTQTNEKEAPYGGLFEYYNNKTNKKDEEI